MRRTIMAIAGLVLLGATAGCGRSSLHSAPFDDSTSPAPQPAVAAPHPVHGPQGRSTPPSTVTRPATGALTDLVDALQRTVIAKRTAHFDFLGGVASQQGAGAQAGGRPSAAAAESGVLTIDGARLSLDHDSQQPGAAPGKTVDDHRIYLGGTLYEKVVPGLLTYQAPADRPWLKIAETEPSGKARNRLLDEQALSGSLMPITQLAGFRSAARISGSGADTVQGQQATRYDIVVDVPMAVAAAGNPAAKAVLAGASRARQAELHYQLWLNADQLPLKVTSDVPGPDGAPAAQIVTYREWGAALPIAPPPPKTVCTTKDLRPL